MTAASGSITLLPNTFKKPRFDPTRDFVPVGQMAELDFVLTTHPGVPARTASEFAALARSDAKYGTFGSAPGTNPHLLAIAFARAAGLSAVHVPYKGNGQALVDLMGGQIAAVFLTAGEALELNPAKKVRVLASSGARRSNLMPDVPTLKESGYEVEASAWFAFFAPAGTPNEVLERLSGAIMRAAGSAELRERLARAGIQAAALPSKELAAKISSEYRQIGNQLRATGFKQQD
jgi:tripartite-type tricarboxylate transporter receptor subunit TctC